MNGEALGIGVVARAMGYENRLFDNTRVHTIDIVMDDWDAFIDYATSEEYSMVSMVIDGEDWGLYLAVEGIEDSFLQRNYGVDYGELYNPTALASAVPVFCAEIDV